MKYSNVSLMQSLVWFSKKKIEEIVLKVLPIASDFVLLRGEIFTQTKGSVLAEKYAEWKQFEAINESY